MARRKKSAKRTLVIVVQDRSRSMLGRRYETIDGFNEYLNTLKGEAKGEVLLTLTQFNTGVTNVHTNKPLKDVPPLTFATYHPEGMTALHDAIGRSIRETEQVVRKADTVLLVVMTDGRENASREYNLDTISDLLSAKREAGWETVFLGAGPDAWFSGHVLGFDHLSSINYSAQAQDHKAAFADVAVASAGVTRGVRARSYFATSPVKAQLEAEAGYTGSAQPQAARKPRKRAAKK